MWLCSKCTFLNENWRNKCKICKSVKRQEDYGACGGPDISEGRGLTRRHIHSVESTGRDISEGRGSRRHSNFVAPTGTDISSGKSKSGEYFRIFYECVNNKRFRINWLYSILILLI